MKLADISIRQPVFAAMTIGGLVVLGLISLGRLELKLEPEIEFPFVVVMTELRGASPETVEREVTDPIEEELNAIEGVRNLSSTSSQGLSTIQVEFEIQYPVDIKLQEVRDKVALARPRLPVDVEPPIVQKFDLSAVGFMTVAMGGSLPLRDLSDFAEHEVKERLQRIAGVGGINILGGREREIRIWLDPLRLTGYGLSIDDVAEALRRENAEMASGRIEGARREWSVTTQGKAQTVAGFGEIVVADRSGRPVRVRDVAVVEDGMSEIRSISRLNGQPGLLLEIVQQSGSDIVAAAQGIREEIFAISEKSPDGLEIMVARDYARMIEEQVSSVLFDMILAAGLVMVMVLLFLRNVRSTLIAALAIPTSVISSFTLLYALDLSLNNTTLMALSLAIGLVIDDAIVVLEAIYRKIESGRSPMEAAHEGSSEVGLAVISTTLAVCGVFVPINFMTSSMGRYLMEFGVAVVVAVLVSTLVAFTLTPMLASRFLRTKPREGAFFRTCERGLIALEHGYSKTLDAALRHRFVTVVIAVLAIWAGLQVAAGLPVNYYTQDDLSEAQINFELPVGTPFPVTLDTMIRIEDVVEEHPFVTGTFSVIGHPVRHAPHRGKLFAMLADKTERDVPAEQTFAELRERVMAKLPELDDLTVGHPNYASSSDEGYSEIQHSLVGPDLAVLERHATSLVARMHADPDFVDVRTSWETGRPQITLEVDRGPAAELGLTAVAMGQTLRMLLAGQKVGSFEDLGRRHDVRIQVLPEYRDDPSKIDLIRVRSTDGQLVPIANAARIRIGEGPVEIQRDDRTRSIRIYANTATDASLADATRKLDAWVEEMGIRAPYSLVAGGQAESMEESAADMGFALGLGLLAVYMILASLFNSFLHPITIMISAPLSFLGGFLALDLTGQSLDIMSALGLLVLMGLVMKNGILLVDYTNQLRDRGMECDAAILAAGPVRMRPVLMTSAALILGLLPLATSDSLGAEFRRPMAIIVIGGLTTSTVLTLIVVPVFYSILDGAKIQTGRSLRWLGQRIQDLFPRDPRIPTDEAPD